MSSPVELDLEELFFHLRAKGNEVQSTTVTDVCHLLLHHKAAHQLAGHGISIDPKTIWTEGTSSLMKSAV